MFTKDDVQRLIADIGASKPETHDEAVKEAREGDVPARYIGNRDLEQHQLPGIAPSVFNQVDLSPLEIGEPYLFGLALDVFDPVSGQVIAVCRPHRGSEPELFLTVRQLGAEVASARMTRAHNDRIAGVLTPAQVEARDKANEQARADQTTADHESQRDPVIV